MTSISLTIEATRNKLNTDLAFSGQMYFCHAVQVIGIPDLHKSSVQLYS